MNARLLPPPLFGLTVLVVDEESAHRQAIRATALRLGLAVECTADGERAISSLNAHPVDAVLLPWGRSGIDPMAVTAAIRALGGRRGRVPILLLADDADAPDAPDARSLRDAGIDACLSGPLLPGLLDAALREVCDVTARGGRADTLPHGGAAFRPAVR